MKQIKVPFPIYEGLEVKNVTADIENGYSIVEYGEKEKKCEFKRGDILYDRMSNGWSWVAIYDKYDKFTYNPIVCKAILNIHDGEIRYNVNVCLDGLRLATTEEEQILFDALAKEGKYWDAEALEVKDFIKVPESIGIYKFKEMVCSNYNKGDGLHISFNDNKQLLSTSDGVYHVQPNDSYTFEKVQCYLQPCKREDLKSGDTAFFSSTFRLAEDITSDLGRYVKIVGNSNYKPSKSGDIIQERNFAEWWYKLIPING